MTSQELMEAIDSGRIIVEHLPQIFDELEGIAEEHRLKAISHLARIDPHGTKPYFQRLNDERLAEAVDNGRLEPNLINLATRVFPRSERLREAAIKSERTPTQALLLLTERANPAQLSLLAKDETRLILAPELLQALVNHEHISEGERMKLESLSNKVANDPEYQIRAGLQPDNISQEDRELMIADKEDSSERKQSIYALLMRMTAAEKVVMAIHGNREVRLLLVRDPNTMISKSAIRSPRMSDNDVEAISQMREVDEDVIRYVAQNTRWMRKYSIFKNIALNPRTPIAIAMRLLPRLRNHDIRAASKDHNIPNTIRIAAGKIAVARGLK